MAARRPLIIGEVLFDVFPNGHRVLGGAPFNVAWNLQGLGLSPLFTSAVGNDDEGREVRANMEAWGMDTSALQINQKWPTGKVRVEIVDDEPQYSILDNQAYDEIQLPAHDVSARDFSLFYVGSLAFRSPTTRSTITQLMKTEGLPRFVDINIRQPWFDRESAGVLLDHAEWIKLNRDELSFLAETECHSADQIAKAVATLRKIYHPRRFFITCGSAGAYAVEEDGETFFAETPKPTPFVDAVGAGDAFSAAVIVGIDRGLPLGEILKAAVQYASNTCTLQGATTTRRDHYKLPVSTP